MDVEHLNVVLDAKLAPLQRALAKGDVEVAKMRASMERLERTTLSSTAGMSSGFRRAGSDVTWFRRQLDRTSRGVLAGSGAMRSLTRSLAFASTAFLGGAGLGAALRYTIGQAGSFESRLNELQAVTRATGRQMRTVSTLAKKLGADIRIPGASAADAAEAMTELAKGGLSMQQSMRAAKGTLQLAAAAQLSNAEAARITVSALNAFRLSGDNATRVADLLAAAANASQGSISDMALALQQASAQAHASGLTVHETVTALTLLAKAGIQGSDAGTSLRVMLQRFIPQGKRASDLMRDLGLSVFDATGKMLPLREIVARYSSVLGDLNPKQRAYVLQTIFGADATRAANIILGDSVGKFDAASKATDRQGEAARVAGAKTKGWEGAVQRAQNAVETLAITVGEKLLPHLTPLLNRFGNWVARLSESEEMQRKLNEKIEASIGFAKRAATQLENMAKAADKVATAIGGWEEVFKLVVAGMVAKKLAGVLAILGRVGGKTGILGSLAAIKAFGPVLGLTIAVKAIAEGDVSAWEAMAAGGLIGARFGPVGAAVGAVVAPFVIAGDRSGGTPGWNSQKQTRKRQIDQAYARGDITAKQRDQLYAKYNLGTPDRGGDRSGEKNAIQGGAGTGALVAGLTPGTNALLVAMGGTGAVSGSLLGSTVGGTHAKNSYHYRGQALDLEATWEIWNKLYANRFKFAELLGPWGLYNWGVRFYNAELQRDHMNHIHVAFTGGPGIVEKLFGGGGAKKTGGGGGAGGGGGGAGGGGGGERNRETVDDAMDRGGGTRKRKLTPAERVKAAVDKARDTVSPKIRESVEKLNDLAVNKLLPKPLIDKLEQRALALQKALRKADTKQEVAAVSRQAAKLNSVIAAAAAVSPKLQEQIDRLNDAAVNGLLPSALVQQLEQRAARAKKALNNVATKADVDAVARQTAGLNNAITAALKQMDIVGAFRERVQAAKGDVAQRLQELLTEPVEQVTPAALAKARELAAKIERQLTTTVVSDAARKRLKTQLEGLQATIVAGLGGMLAAVERSHGRFENAWAKLGAKALKAFDAVTRKGLEDIEERFAAKTPSRLKLDQLEAERAAAQAAEDMKDAQTELAAAEKELAEARAAGDPEELARAEERLSSARRRLADIAYEERRSELERLALLEEAARDKQLAAEVDAWEEKRAEQREQLEAQLAEWKQQIMTGGEAAIGEIEQKLGPLAEAAGGVLGVGFTGAWTESFKELRKLWEEFLREMNAARVEVGLKPIGGASAPPPGGGGGGRVVPQRIENQRQMEQAAAAAARRPASGGGSSNVRAMSHGGQVPGWPRWPADGVPVLAAGGEHVLNPPQIALIRRTLASASPGALAALRAAAGGRWGHLRRFLPARGQRDDEGDAVAGFSGLPAAPVRRDGDATVQLLREQNELLRQLLSEPRVIDMDMNFPAPPAADPHAYAQRAKQAMEAHLG